MTKVIRLSDGKIFSNPRGAAMAIDMPVAKRIEYACKGYIPDVEGEQYEWYYDDEEDRGRPEYKEGFWDRKGKWVARNYVLKWRAKFVQNWLGTISDPHRWRRSSEVAQGMCDVSSMVDEKYKWEPSAHSVSKHLHAYADFYEGAFGMQERDVNVPFYRGRMFKFISEDVLPDFDAILQELVDDKTWGRGKPVIRINDGKWFRSMAEAERETGVPYVQIFHVCEGDIPFVDEPLTHERIAFRYATEIDSE